MGKFNKKFAKDRDKILYSKEFRRLNGKTQVFVAGFDMNCRNRLTHTLEVAQIAKQIRYCFLKEDLDINLIEAIAYAHDVGHTPFGHIGERYLNYLTNGCYKKYYITQGLPDEERGFKHNFQGIRVLTKLEKSRDRIGEIGLNISNEVLYGVYAHTDGTCKGCVNYNDSNNQCSINKIGEKCEQEGKLSLGFYDNEEINSKIKKEFQKREASIVEKADEIAQRHHDIEDALYASIIKKENIIKFIYDNLNVGEKLKEKIEEIVKEKDRELYIPLFGALIIDIYIKKLKLGNHQDIVYKTEEILNFDNKFKNYLFTSVVNSHIAQSMDGKAQFILDKIISAYFANPLQLPDVTILTVLKGIQERIINKQKTNREENKESIKKIKETLMKTKGIENKVDATINFFTTSKKTLDLEVGEMRIIIKSLHNSQIDVYKYSLLRTIVDYIAGMTDAYAIKIYSQLYEATNQYENKSAI